MQKILIHSIEDMKAFGGKLAQYITDTTVIELIGDVGAGKTTLVKGFAAALGVKEVVQSPSFTILSHYEANKGLLLDHYDFYRLNDPGIIGYELQESLFQPKTITVIEWGQSVESILPDERIKITIIPTSDTTRELHIEGILL